MLIDHLGQLVKKIQLIVQMVIWIIRRQANLRSVISRTGQIFQSLMENLEWLIACSVISGRLHYLYTVEIC